MVPSSPLSTWVVHIDPTHATQTPQFQRSVCRRSGQVLTLYPIQEFCTLSISSVVNPYGSDASPKGSSSSTCLLTPCPTTYTFRDIPKPWECNRKLVTVLLLSDVRSNYPEPPSEVTRNEHGWRTDGKATICTYAKVTTGPL
jgi:hypothetical protein